MRNESAFPYTAKTLVGWADDGSPNYVEDTFPGMTLRDYFAAKAVSALVYSFKDQMAARDFERVIARQAYLLADAMIAERDKGETK